MNKKVYTLIGIVSMIFNAHAGTIVDTQLTQSTTTIPVEVETSYASDKVWRGDDLGKSEAEAVVSTEIKLPSDVSVDLSAAYGASDSSNASDEATELAAVFSKNVADYLLSLSYIWYSEGFDSRGQRNAQEIGLSASKLIGPVTVTLTQYLAVEGDNGGYSQFEAVYSNDFDVLPIELDFSGELGYLTQDSKFTHFEIRVSTDLPFTSDIMVQPFVAYNVELGESFGTTNQNDLFFGGIQFKRGF